MLKGESSFTYFLTDNKMRKICVANLLYFLESTLFI